MKLKFMHYIRNKQRWHWYIDGDDREWGFTRDDDTEATIEWLKQFLTQKEQHGRDDSNV